MTDEIDGKEMANVIRIDEAASFGILVWVVQP